MSDNLKVTKSKKKYYYIISLFAVVLLMFVLNNTVLTEHTGGTWSQNPLSIPVAFFCMLGLGFLINVVFNRPVEINKAAKFALYIYLLLMVALPILIMLVTYIS